MAWSGMRRNSNSNKNMKTFYEKIGLVKEAVLKDHFYKGEEEIIYSMFFE